MGVWGFGEWKEEERKRESSLRLSIGPFFLLGIGMGMRFLELDRMDNHLSGVNFSVCLFVDQLALDWIGLFKG